MKPSGLLWNKDVFVRLPKGLRASKIILFNLVAVDPPALTEQQSMKPMTRPLNGNYVKERKIVWTGHEEVQDKSCDYDEG